MSRSAKIWAIIIVVLWMNILNVEGRLFPAAAQMKLIASFATKKYDPGQWDCEDLHKSGPYTVFWIKSARLRPSCNFAGMEWHDGKRGGRNNPVTSRLGPAILQPDGVFYAGPWIAHVALRDFPDTYADVLHKCHVFGIPLPWKTRTPFWN